ncbi:MAG: 23S rRNA (uracil(1939)-C(5))-methyltransferase RlmD [Planctomycetes bacterium]|nr:23S rRNA (uracil(1939)-C(5))-methyltransferase RlmD [Planctomycetota bacterium]
MPRRDGGGPDQGRGEDHPGTRGPDRAQRPPRAPLEGHSAPLRLGEELSLDVEAMGDGPDALCRIGRYVVFVAGGLPGERLRVRVTSAARKHGRADLVAVERPSPHRVLPACTHFERCGGCDYQHLAYPEQLRLKTERVAKALRHATRIDAPPVAAMAGPDDPWEQRTKIVLHTKPATPTMVAGLFARRSRSLVPIRECPVSDQRGFRAALATVEAARRSGVPAWDPHTDSGVLRAVLVRAAKSSGRVQIDLITRNGLPAPERLLEQLVVQGPHDVVVHSHGGPVEQLVGGPFQVLRGEARLVETVEGIAHHVSPAAFFQTSAFGARWLVATVLRLLPLAPGARVLDVYSGGGLLALALARAGMHVTAIEDNRRAVADAETSARANGIAGIRFVHARAEDALREVPAQPGFTAVVLDPPRAGCHPAVLHALGERLKPRHVVYVACDPEALARDLAQLLRMGYSLERVEPVDMFPHSHHVEAVALLERRVLGRRLIAVGSGT